jgi:hypothetical protein
MPDNVDTSNTDASCTLADIDWKVRIVLHRSPRSFVVGVHLSDVVLE